MRSKKNTKIKMKKDFFYFLYPLLSEVDFHECSYEAQEKKNNNFLGRVFNF